MPITTTPSFAVTAKVGVASVSTANTARDGTGTIATVYTVPASVSGKVNRIVLQATIDPADSIVTIFLHDGATYWLFDEFDIGNPVTSGTTTPGFRTERRYDDLILPTGWSVRAAITAALGSGVMNVFVFANETT